MIETEVKTVMINVRNRGNSIINIIRNGARAGKTGARCPGRGFLLAGLLAAAMMLLLCACGQTGDEMAVYRIMVEGSPKESGVIEFVGLTMNVYRDAASNPCGDCEEQPVSVYVGASAANVAGAMANAVEEANDLWDVVGVSEGVLELREKVAGSVTEEPELSGPAGLTLTGEFFAAGSAPKTSSGSGTGDGSVPSDWKTITNIDGSEMQVPQEAPERIAAVYGPSYEALVVLGAEDRIVLCSDVQFENFPWAQKIFSKIMKLPYLENVHSSVSAEEIKTRDPQLVLTFNRPNEIRQMNAMGMAAVYAVTSHSLEDVKAQLKVYAEAVGGDAPERAERYTEYFDEKISMIRSVTDELPEEQRPSVYYAGIDILTTYGNRSDLCEVIEAAGGHSVTEELDAGNHAQINFEQLAQWNPDYIFIDHGSMNERDTVEEILSGVKKNSQYQVIGAVRSDQVYLTPSGVFYWDMGLQKVLLVMHMAKILHPDQFADLDMEQELMDFYSEFYSYDLSWEEAAQILNRQDPS